MRLLTRWVCSGQNRRRLSETELELPEQPLALAHAQLDSIGFVDPRRQRLAIPEIDPQSRVTWLFPQHAIDFVYLLFTAESLAVIPTRKWQDILSGLMILGGHNCSSCPITYDAVLYCWQSLAAGPLIQAARRIGAPRRECKFFYLQT